MPLTKSKTGLYGIHDFFNDRAYLISTIGFSPSKNPAIYLYRAWIFFMFFYLQSMSAYAIYLSKNEKITMINAVHTFLVPSFGVCGLSARLLTHRSLKNTWDMVIAGIYQYKNEDLDEEQKRMMEKTVSEVRKKSVITIAIFTMGAAWNMICFPLSQLATVVEDDRDHSHDLVNPYLPLVLFTPFSTRTLLGYWTAYIMGILLFFYAYGVAICMNEIFVSCIVQLKVHLQILNHSIKNIQRRACQMYKIVHEIPHRDIAKEDFFVTHEFQNCLYMCLRANIQHHQALLRFKKEWQTFGGATLLALMTVGCFVYASFIYLSFQALPVTLIANYIVTLFVELAYPYCTCLFGEDVIEESSALFQELYSTPWMYCNKRFNKALTIIMTRSLEPIQISALILQASASLSTYGDLITAAYKAANLVRQSDKH